MASHHQHPNVFPLWPTPTQEQQERWLRPQAYQRGKPIDAGEYLRRRLRERRPFGERLVERIHRSAVAIGLAFYTLAVLTACYFAFELGRGVHL